ncbi:MAG: helix-turn-helix domain-containing protein [Parasporobacterium sp.]|nr:helix-turn-helix domain-containing protein [Parasporobacterium sp.]
MKLSMWMLADALKEYDPEINIVNGKCILQGARICSDELKISKTAVFLSENTPGQIVLANGHDMICVKCDDILTIFNVVLDTFEKYNEWENLISEELDAECSEYRILELTYDIFPHYFIIADASFLMHTVYGNTGDYSDEELFRITRANNQLPAEALVAINSQEKVRKEGIGAYRLEGIPNSGIDTAARNLFLNRKHTGWLVVLCSRPFTEGEIQFIDEIGTFIEKCRIKNRVNEDNLSKSSVLLDIIEERDYNPGQVAERLGAFGWYEMDRKQVYVLWSDDTDSNSSLIPGRLSAFSDDIFQVMYRDTIVVVVNHSLTDIPSLEKVLIGCSELTGCRIGRSSCFTNIFQLRTYVDTARIAAHFSGLPKSIVDFSDITLPYIYSLIMDYSLTDILHPSLAVLSKYDAAHGSELYDTLRIFLENERNYSEVSRKLNIHRSTLMYRLDRIAELTASDPNDPDERFHMMLSFRLKNEM